MRRMGMRIQQKREELGLTQEELGKKLGVSRQTIYKWESGSVQHFDRSYVQKMADLFHCSPAWLMNMESTNAVVTYEAKGREPVTLSVDESPIIGEVGKRAALYKAALDVPTENIPVAIELLKSLTIKEGDNNAPK
jgi:DNA-binding XRE family transcriptional regulator